MSPSVIVGLVVVFVLVFGARAVFAVKAGAILSTRPEIEYARRVVSNVWRRHGFTVTVTSGYDGTHKAESLHYEGLAEDYRTNDVPSNVLPTMVAEVRAQLGSNYDVILEATHLHVEYDPA